MHFMTEEPAVMSNSLEKMGYTVERLGKDNLGDIQKLYAEIHSRPYPLSHFEKKYDTAYTGAKYIGYITYNKRHLPIAYYGVLPCFIKYDGKLILAAQSADVMTHPKYRYKGLFIHLANMTIELCRQSGIRLLFAMPNQVALHGFLIKLQWQLTETMNHFVIPVKFIPFERFIPKTAAINKLYESYKRSVLRRYLIPQYGINNTLLAEGYAGINRDDSYLSYKTYNTTYVLKINQSLVWLKITNKITIGDISIYEDQFDIVIKTLHKIALKLGLRSIEYHCSHRTKMCALFAERYNPKLSLHVLFKDIDAGIPLDKIVFTYADAEVF